MRRLFFVALAMVVAAVSASAQTRGRARTAPPAAPARRPVQEQADVTCPSPLGAGLKTKLNFCDVLTGRDPAQGIIIKFPPHRGVLTLHFDLHNRHTYSDDEMRAKRGFASYTSTIGVLTLDNTLITRSIAANEFRRVEDLLDRIGGGAGAGGVKAVAPLGLEPITVSIPGDVDQVSILGEKLTVLRSDGVPATYSAAGRPIAIISNASIEYVPAPAPARRSPSKN
jgi:hypothetical protein